ncbi:DNA invertase [Oribacterium sp. C9]|uniref:recombinase family protein n=1 Tax=Oribacterium sp. C9 TaxID=1943579 RepID=UPI00098F61F7|nr:recombinase family protein [Oribacterium sp. C9]OON87459.1 DNA invertase [Oribacterium sp. C9]
MIDESKRLEKQAEKAKVRKRIQIKVDPDHYEYIPAKKQIDYYDNDAPMRVGIYVRVSTDDIRQTTSYELQKKYYEDFVNRHPRWTLEKIYADEGISGTSLKHRDAFNEMIADSKAGKLDLIITKSVSRFARNVMITIGTARDLARLTPPVGIFFESECIFSLNDESQMALTFQATMAEEESHIRSRSMETSLRMRLDNGIPLTPKLLGYTHDIDGNLVINPEEAPTVKLTFFMYLYGYSTQQIANALIALERKSYLGNIKWTPSSIIQILRNERHCGDVLTRKTYTEDFRTHRTLKNRGNRPQSHYFNHHEAIISRDDFIAVQRLLDSSKYGNKSILPELRVIDKGILKGFVSINPRWSGFKENDYFQASHSVYKKSEESDTANQDTIQIEVEAGDLDLRGFEIARSEFFDSKTQPYIHIADKEIRFNSVCVRKFGTNNTVELLIHPLRKKFAVRPTTNENRNRIIFSKLDDGMYVPRSISTAAFSDTLFKIMGWNTEYKYRIIGSLYEKENELAYIFDANESEAYIKSSHYPNSCEEDGTIHSQPFTPCGNRIRAIPECWVENFGKPFYLHNKSLHALERQSESEWKLRMEGQLYETGKKINVTPYETLRSYIRQELSSVNMSEETNESSDQQN